MINIDGIMTNLSAEAECENSIGLKCKNIYFEYIEKKFT